jgi:hypothetical protein
MKDRIYLKDLNPAPAANSDAPSVLRLQPNKRYNEIEIKASVAAAKIAAGFGDIRFLLGLVGQEKVQRVKTFGELDDYNALIDPETRGVQNDIDGGPAFAIFEFGQFWRKQYVAAERMSLDLPNGWTGKLEIDVVDSAAAKSLAFRGLVEDLPMIPAQNRNLINGVPVIEKWYRSGRNMNDTEITVLDLTRKDVLTLLDLYNPAGTSISYVEITKDGKLIFQNTKQENDVQLIRHGLRPDDRRFTIVPGATDNPVDDWNLNGSEQFEVKIQTAGQPDAGATVKMISHRVGLPD